MNENESAVSELLEAVEDVAPVQGEQDVQQDVQPDATASGGVTSYEVAPEAVALLSDIAQTLESSSSQYLYSMDSSQAQYFAGILSARPFDQYVSWYDAGGYYLYYGHDLLSSGGDYVHIYRHDYDRGYVIDRGTGVPAGYSGLVVSNCIGGAAEFPEVRNAQNNLFLCCGLVVALGLFVLSKIFFR